MTEKQRKTLEQIVQDYEETLPRDGNSINEMLARAEYLLAKKMLLKQEAPPSIVDSLLNREHDKNDWLQKPGEHTFNDMLGGDTRYSEPLLKKERE